MRTWQKVLLLSIPTFLIFLFLVLFSIVIFRFRNIERISLSKEHYVTLSLSGEIFEKPPRDVFSQMILEDRPTILNLLHNIQMAQNDRSVKGLILMPSNLQLGWAKLEELRNALIHFKSSGKELVSFLEHATTSDYFLATASEKIYMLPTGQLFLVGLMSEMMFLKGTFDKIGIQADFEHIGQFKTSAEIYTRDKMSTPHRRMINELLDDIFEQLLTAIEETRGIPKDRLVRLLDQGPFDTKTALKVGLIDSAVYWDQLENLLGIEMESISKIGYSRYAREHDITRQFSFAPKIALIFAQGTIVFGSSGYHPYYGDVLGSETISRYIRKAADDNSIEAIVMRIDSPGGSGAAADAIWHEIVLAQEKKPFVVSMSDVAASGGYYIAMAADTIVAQPGTITGSIGVLSGKFNMKALYNKIGITKETVTRGKHVDIYSDYRGFTREERKLIREQLQDFYNNFVTKAAEGRHKTFENIDKVARGRVWTGRQAVKIGLVDTLGGLDTALNIAKKMAGLLEDEKIQIVVYPKEKSWIESFIKRNIQSMSFGHQLFPQELFNNWEQVSTLFHDKQILALMPYQIKIR